MKQLRNTKGFTLIELMIATLVVTTGLTAVALMQTTAMRGDHVAQYNSTGSQLACSWADWMAGMVMSPGQMKIPYQDPAHLLKKNFVLLASLDSDVTDDTFVMLVLPAAKEDIVKTINGDMAFKTIDGKSLSMSSGYQFRKPDGVTKFTAADLPPAPPTGAVMVWSIGANIPENDKATVEVSIIYTNAFINNSKYNAGLLNKRAPRMRFVVGS